MSRIFPAPIIGQSAASGAQVIGGSLKFDINKNTYLKKTPSAGNRRTFTLSWWIKRADLSRDFIFTAWDTSSYTDSSFLNFAFTTNTITIETGATTLRVTNALYRDPSAWYHIVFAVDTTQSNSAEIFKLYVNGIQVTSFSTNNTVTQNTELGWNNSAYEHNIGKVVTSGGGSANNLDGLLSQFYHIDGQQLGPDSFGFTDPLTNTWRPKKFIATGPNNGSTWSNNWSASGNGFAAGAGPAQVFDGSSENYLNNAAGGQIVTWDTSSYTLGGNLKILCYSSSAAYDIYVNGTKASDTTTSISLIDCGTVSDINEIQFAGTTYDTSDGLGSAGIYVYEILIDGVPLLDGDTLNVGVNGFYLPFDGNSPIGKDQSGQGNNWTPVNFGGSNTIEKATGALPILNTLGGTVARSGVFGSEVSKYYTLTGSSNSSTGYVFENEGTKPTLSMIRGTTHTFDYTSATSHPLYLSSLSDGKHNAKAYSVSFDGTGDYLSIGASADFNFGTGDFTIETFAYINNVPNGPIVNNIDNGGFTTGGFSINEDGNIFVANSSGTYALWGNVTYPSGEWFHIAMTRSGTTGRVFINGVLNLSVTNSTDIGTSGTNDLNIGARRGGGSGVGSLAYYLNGYISNLRIIKGTALYTSNFTLPTTLENVTNTKLLCCQDSNATTAVVSPGAITANGDAAATNTYNPFLYDTDGYFGVDTSTSNVTKMTVPHYAPDTLYYYCNVHSGMGNSISVTTDTKKADPYAWKNVLGLPLVGSTNDVSNQINSGSTTQTVTNNGGATASSSLSNFYGGSFTFDGSDDYLSLGSAASEWKFLHDGTTAWTVECWLYFNSFPGLNATFISTDWGGSHLTGFTLVVQANNQLNVRMGNGSNTGDFMAVTESAATAIQTGKWHHVAATYDLTTLRLFIDGVLVGSTTSKNTADTGNPLHTVYIGGNPDTTYGSKWLNGNLSDVRIYKGVAKYISNFIPASTNPDILPDTPSGVSGGSKLTKITDGAVSFDGTGDYLSFATNSDFGLASGDDFTIECFTYATAYTNSTSYSEIIRQGTNDAGSDGIYFNVNSTGTVSFRMSGTTKTTTGSLNIGGWNHIAVCRASGTVYIAINGIVENFGSVTNSSTTGGFRIGADFEGNNFYKGQLSNVHFVKGTALYTSNFTPPTRTLTNVTNTKLLCCQSTTSAGAAAVSPNLGGINDGRVWSDASNLANPGLLFDGDDDTFVDSSTTSGGNLITSATQFTVPEGQTLTIRTQNGSASNISVNGSNVATSSGNVVTTLLTGGVGGTLVTSITAPSGFNLYYLKVNGVALMDPVAPIGDATATNFNPFTTDIHTVRGQETGYATWNPLKMGTSDVSMSEGNLFWRTTSDGPDKCTYSTIGMDSGKFYWENEVVEATATAIGIANVFANQDAGPANAHNWMYYSATGQVYLDGSASSYGDAFNTNGTIIGVAFDRDNLTLEFYKNGVSQGKLTSISGLTDSETYFAMCGDSGGGSQSQVRANFGQKPFKFPPPEGFQPLNAANVRPSTVIARPDQYVGITTWNGDGSSTRNFRDFNFAPDMIWYKERTNIGGNWSHTIFDIVRGDDVRLHTNTTGAETAEDIRFLSDGFGVGNASRQNSSTSGANYVAWCWKAGGNKNTFNVDDVGYATASAAGLDGGDMSPTGASVGTKQGFSILKFTAPSDSGTKTISHGLSQTPEFYIFKETNRSAAWYIFHHSVCDTNEKFLRFDTTNLQSGAGNVWGNLPTSSLISIQNGSLNAVSSQNILYAWHSVPGLQKFGRYQGNGSTDGPFIELGFRPAVILLKNDTNDGNNWWIIDSERSKYNGQYAALFPNTSGTENTTSAVAVDFLSNGFKCRGADGGQNPGSGNSFVIYAAWAEAPAFNLYGGGANAR